MNGHRRDLSLREFEICGRIFSLNVPSDPEQILSDAVEGRVRDPYWGQIWDSAPKAASCIIRSTWNEGNSVLELGCGCGLLGIAALSCGLEVTLSDHDPEAVELAVTNARINGYSNSKSLVLDWNDPPTGSYDVLLANDVLYEQSFHGPLLESAQRLLTATGPFCIGDPGRQLAKSFLQSASRQGWSLEFFDENLQNVLMPQTNRFQWIVLRRGG